MQKFHQLFTDGNGQIFHIVKDHPEAGMTPV